MLQEKYDILEKYSIFLNSEGFGVIKQTVDEYAEKIRESQKSRVTSDYKSDTFKPLWMCQKDPNCILTPNHTDSCKHV